MQTVATPAADSTGDLKTALQHAAMNANVYLNVNGPAGEDGWDSRLFRYYEALGAACAPLPWDKLIWGTDNIGYDFAGYEQAFGRAGRADDLAGFFAENARTLLGL